jgi:hypothetical protein
MGKKYVYTPDGKLKEVIRDTPTLEDRLKGCLIAFIVFFVLLLALKDACMSRRVQETSELSTSQQPSLSCQANEENMLSLGKITNVPVMKGVCTSWYVIPDAAKHFEWATSSQVNVEVQYRTGVYRQYIDGPDAKLNLPPIRRVRFQGRDVNLTVPIKVQ